MAEKLIERVELDMSGVANIVKAAKSRRMARKAVSKMARYLSPKVRSAAPRRTGLLKQAQGVKVGNSKKWKSGAYAVQGARHKVQKVVGVPGRTKPVKVVPGNYDHLVNAGTRPHSLAKGSRKSRKRRVKGQTIVVPEVGQGSGSRHPGTRAVKFRQRVWEAHKKPALAIGQQVFADDMKALVAKESDRLMSKLGKR